MATGEHCHNRVMFKQFLQADALQFCQIDCCRLAGPNEILSVLLMASKFGGKGECNNVDMYVFHLHVRRDDYIELLLTWLDINQLSNYKFIADNVGSCSRETFTTYFLGFVLSTHHTFTESLAGTS